MARSLRELCALVGGHEPHPGDPLKCKTCGTTLRPAEPARAQATAVSPVLEAGQAAESLFSLEERLVLAALFREGAKSAPELVAVFSAFDGPDQVPVDLISAPHVAGMLEDLWYRDLVKPARGTADRYDIAPELRELMRLGGAVMLGGVLGVLHG